MAYSNFLFLAEHFPALEKMGRLAEMYLYTDADACLENMGSLAEAIVKYIFKFDGLVSPPGNENTHANRVGILREKDMLSKDISDIFYVLGIKRDEAADEGYDSFEECKSLIEMTHKLSVWFMQIYGDSEFEPVPFVMPEDISDRADYEKLIKEKEELSAGPEEAPAAVMTEPAIPEPAHVHFQASQYRQQMEKANRKTRLSEKEARSIIDILIESDKNKAKQEHLRARKGFRQFQLVTMGFIAIFIGPLVLFTTSVVHKLPFPNSISETATTANRAGAILPFCLGALALFALTYAIVYAYDKTDKIFTAGMASGFTIVAMQMCSSDYILLDPDLDRVGLFGVVPEISNTLHMVGAIAGFGSMIFWIMLCFRKSDKRKDLRTKEKHTRNNIYFYLGIAMILSLGLFILDLAGLFDESFPVVFVAECAMLLFGGVSCIIKGGLFLKDKARSV